MSNSSKDYSNPSSMVDVDFYREWDGSTISITVYDHDDTEVWNLVEQGYKVVKVVTIL